MCLWQIYVRTQCTATCCVMSEKRLMAVCLWKSLQTSRSECQASAMENWREWPFMMNPEISFTRHEQADVSVFTWGIDGSWKLLGEAVNWLKHRDASEMQCAAGKALLQVLIQMTFSNQIEKTVYSTRRNFPLWKTNAMPKVMCDRNVWTMTVFYVS